LDAKDGGIEVIVEVEGGAKLRLSSCLQGVDIVGEKADVGGGERGEW
jgi:hypothetical protein